MVVGTSLDLKVKNVPKECALAIGGNTTIISYTFNVSFNILSTLLENPVSAGIVCVVTQSPLGWQS